MNEAIPASAMVMVTMLRMPDRMTGMASGSLIRNRICSRVLPMPLAASRIAGSTFVSPVCVLRTMGSRAYTVSAMTAVALPTPENGIRKPSMEMDGMVYRKLISPSVGRADRWNSLIRMPTAPPNTTAIRIATSEISRCSHKSPAKKSQRPASREKISCSIVIHPFLRSPVPDSFPRTGRSAGSAPAGSHTVCPIGCTAAGTGGCICRSRYRHP